MRRSLIIACLVGLMVIFVYASEKVDQQTQTQPNLVEESKPETKLIKFTEFYVDSEYHLIAGDYLVDHSIYIGVTGKLIIDPGTRFLFNKDCGIVCEGRIVAVGTSTKPIEFKAFGNARWGSLVIIGSEFEDSQIEYCNFVHSSDMYVGNSQIYRYSDDEYDPDDLIRIGGALTLVKTKINVENCNFSRCNSSRGSAIFVLGSEVWIENCNFSNNMTDDGAVFVSDSHCVLRNCDFVENTSSGNAAGISCRESCCGFESETHKPSVEIWRCNFINNKTEHHGAAITAFDKIRVDVDDSTFENNSGGKERCFGGAILSAESILILRNSKFKTNVGTSGGAIHVSVHNNPVDWMKLEIYNCIFEKNSAMHGGAISNGKIQMIIENSEFIENKVETSGGAIFCSEFARFDIYKTKFVGNKAKDGGALQIDCNDITEGSFQECEFKDNIASETGGAISLRLYQTNEDVILFKDCVFKDNKPDDKYIK